MESTQCSPFSSEYAPDFKVVAYVYINSTFVFSTLIYLAHATYDYLLLGNLENGGLVPISQNTVRRVGDSEAEIKKNITRTCCPLYHPTGVSRPTDYGSFLSFSSNFTVRHSRRTGIIIQSVKSQDPEARSRLECLSRDSSPAGPVKS